VHLKKRPTHFDVSILGLLSHAHNALCAVFNDVVVALKEIRGRDRRFPRCADYTLTRGLLPLPLILIQPILLVPAFVATH
jgi:hypothetical protein